MQLRKLHYFSGIILTVFILVHLFNHLFALLGAEAHIAMMTNLRVVYRNIVIESILILAVLVQVISGIKLVLNKRKTATNFWAKFQVRTGLYIAFFLGIHLSAVLLGRTVMNLDTNFYFGVAGINTFPFYLFFVPYYGLAIIAFFGHIAAIHYHKMKQPILGLSVVLQAKIILAIGFVVTLVTFYGLTNGFGGVDIPTEYGVMIGK